MNTEDLGYWNFISMNKLYLLFNAVSLKAVAQLRRALLCQVLRQKFPGTLGDGLGIQKFNSKSVTPLFKTHFPFFPDSTSLGMY